MKGQPERVTFVGTSSRQCSSARQCLDVQPTSCDTIAISISSRGRRARWQSVLSPTKRRILTLHKATKRLESVRHREKAICRSACWQAYNHLSLRRICCQIVAKNNNSSPIAFTGAHAVWLKWNGKCTHRQAGARATFWRVSTWAQCRSLPPGRLQGNVDRRQCTAHNETHQRASSGPLAGYLATFSVPSSPTPAIATTPFRRCLPVCILSLVREHHQRYAPLVPPMALNNDTHSDSLKRKSKLPHYMLRLLSITL